MDPLIRHLYEKQARNLGVSSADLDAASPTRMEDALRLFGQARSLARPSDEELKKQKITRQQLDRAIRRLHATPGSRFADARYSEPLHMAAGAGIGGAIGGGLGVLGTDNTALRLLPVLGLGAGGALVGRQVAQARNSRLARAMRVLRGRGILSPVDLDKVAPLIAEYRTRQG